MDVRKQLVPAQVREQLQGNINGGASCLPVAVGRRKGSCWREWDL